MPQQEFLFMNDGLGEVIKQNLLRVPSNQRPYAWKVEHVRELFDDLREEVAGNEELYFLGTIVLVESKDRKLIADGQQRIATTSIVLARCRDKRAVKDARVSNPVLARYYLLCFERAAHPGSGELQPSADVAKVNLEHILPKEFRNDLGISRPEHQDLLSRLGNQTVMSSEWNRDIGNLPFNQKRDTYGKSAIHLTADLHSLAKFTRDEIDQRQAAMSELAPAIWSLKFDA